MKKELKRDKGSAMKIIWNPKGGEKSKSNKMATNGTRNNDVKSR